MKLYLCIALLYFASTLGCAGLGSIPAECPSEDAVVTIRIGDKSFPVKIDAGLFDGDYMTVEEFKSAIEAQRVEEEVVE
jgi:hypothetical protein